MSYLDIRATYVHLSVWTVIEIMIIAYKEAQRVMLQ
jgi:hypothetical protein